MSRLLLLCLFVVAARAADYDLLIRNARVIDGSGNPWYLADIGIKSGKIAAIGKLASANADRTTNGYILIRKFLFGNLNRESRKNRLQSTRS